jgi:hypothetical protein
MATRGKHKGMSYAKADLSGMLLAVAASSRAGAVMQKPPADIPNAESSRYLITNHQPKIINHLPSSTTKKSSSPCARRSTSWPPLIRPSRRKAAGRGRLT